MSFTATFSNGYVATAKVGRGGVVQPFTHAWHCAGVKRDGRAWSAFGFSMSGRGARNRMSEEKNLFACAGATAEFSEVRSIDSGFATALVGRASAQEVARACR